MEINDYICPQCGSSLYIIDREEDEYYWSAECSECRWSYKYCYFSHDDLYETLEKEGLVKK